MIYTSLFRGRELTMLPALPDSCAELIICDYKSTKEGRSFNPGLLWNNYYRILKNDGVVIVIAPKSIGQALYNISGIPNIFTVNTKEEGLYIYTDSAIEPPSITGRQLKNRKALYTRLLELYTRPYDFVLSVPMAEGDLGIVCAEMQRNFIGIENRPTAFNKAYIRINTANEN